MMFLAIRLFVITLLTGSMVLSLAQAEQASGSLVFKLTGESIQKVSVNILLVEFKYIHPRLPQFGGQSGRIISMTVTPDDSGRLVIENLPSATYKVE